MQELQTAGAAMYQQPGAGAAPGGDAGAQPNDGAKKDDNVQDADFKMN